MLQDKTAATTEKNSFSFAGSKRKIETNAKLTVLSASHKSVSLYVLTSTHLFSRKKKQVYSG